jgi:metal-responsive CopG/Arc/MetJ family transcriptional regulator
MSKRFVQFNLSLPEPLYFNVKELSATGNVSMTHFIREAVRAKVETAKTGLKHCATGETCAMVVLHGSPAFIKSD